MKISFLFIPTLLIALFWVNHKIEPFSDDACYYFTSLEYLESFFNNGLTGFTTALSTAYRPLLITLLGFISSLITGTHFNLVAGLTNSFLVLSLTYSTYKIFNYFYKKSFSILLTLFLLSLHWIVYLMTIFESQLAHLVCLNFIILSLLNIKLRPKSNFWPICFGFFSGLSFLARPFESIIILSFTLIYLFIAQIKKLVCFDSKKIIYALLSFLIPSASWLFFTFSGLVNWLNLNTHNDSVGPFSIDEKTFIGFAKAILVEFSYGGFIILILFSISIYRHQRKVIRWFSLNKLALPVSYIFTISLAYPFLFTLLFPMKNPIYFVPNFFILNILFLIILKPIIQKNKIFGATLIALLIGTNMTLNASSIFDLTIIKKNMSLYLQHRFNLPRELHKQEENIYCKNKTSL